MLEIEKDKESTATLVALWYLMHSSYGVKNGNGDMLTVTM